MGHKKLFSTSLISRRTPSLFSRGGPDVQHSAERDPKFSKPAPGSVDRGIGGVAQLKKFERQLAREAQGIRRSRRT